MSRIGKTGWLVGLAWLAAGAAGAYDNGDWQFWNTDAVEYKFTDRVKGKVETEFYFGDDMSDFFYRHVDAGASYKVATWFEAGLFYRFVQEKKNGEWMDEDRPHINGTFLGTLGPVAWSDRNRFEYRMRENAEDNWRYRNRVRVSSAAKWTSLKIQPYVEDELFYDFTADDWNQNRVSAGLSTQPASWLKADLYYLLQATRKDGSWSNANILGLNLKLAF